MSTLAHSGIDRFFHWRKFFEIYPRMMFIRRKIADQCKKELMF